MGGEGFRNREWCQIGWLKCLKRLPGSRAAGTAKISKWCGFSNLFVAMDGTVIGCAFDIQKRIKGRTATSRRFFFWRSWLSAMKAHEIMFCQGALALETSSPEVHVDQ